MTPIDNLSHQILSIFSKAEQKRLIGGFDEREFEGLIELSLKNVQQFEDKILCSLFEEDLIDNLEEDNQRHNFNYCCLILIYRGSGSFNQEMVADKEEEGVSQRLKKRKFNSEIMSQGFQNPFL